MVTVNPHNMLIVKEFENSGRGTGSNKPEMRDKVKERTVYGSWLMVYGWTFGPDSELLGALS